MRQSIKERMHALRMTFPPNYIKAFIIPSTCLLYTSQDKMVDLNCFTVEAAMRMVAGTIEVY